MGEEEEKRKSESERARASEWESEAEEDREGQRKRKREGAGPRPEHLQRDLGLECAVAQRGHLGEESAGHHDHREPRPARVRVGPARRVIVRVRPLEQPAVDAAEGPCERGTGR